MATVCKTFIAVLQLQCNNRLFLSQKHQNKTFVHKKALKHPIFVHKPTKFGIGMSQVSHAHNLCVSTCQPANLAPSAAFCVPANLLNDASTNLFLRTWKGANGFLTSKFGGCWKCYSCVPNQWCQGTIPAIWDSVLFPLWITSKQHAVNHVKGCVTEDGTSPHIDSNQFVSTGPWAGNLLPSPSIIWYMPAITAY